MKNHDGLIPAALLLLLITAGGSASVATEETSQQEEIECQVCHADPEQSAETLTDQGLYYQYMQTLAGYDQVLERFESCAYCHSVRAGDPSMTAQGHRFRWMMEDMAGLRAWLDENHPAPEDR